MCVCVHVLEARGNARNDPLWPPPYLFRQDLSICIASHKAQGILQKARKSPRAGRFGGVLWNVLVDTGFAIDEEILKIYIIQDRKNGVLMSYYRRLHKLFA